METYFYADDETAYQTIGRDLGMLALSVIATEAVKKVKGGGKGGRDVGNITEKLDTNNIPNMIKQDIIDNIPNDWNYTDHNGFIYIRDADGKVRIRIDPPDKITDYPHVHVYDRKIEKANRR